MIDAEKQAIDEAKQASVTELLVGACTHRYSKAFLNEFIRWVKSETGKFNVRTVDKLMREEYGPRHRSAIGGTKLQAWQAAEEIRDSAWLNNGAEGIYSYRPRSFSRWIDNIVKRKLTAADLNQQSRGLLGACLYHGGFDFDVEGLDD